MNPATCKDGSKCKDLIGNVKPCAGTLWHLRTKAEVASRVETIEAYCCEIPVKNTSKTIAAIRKLPHYDKEHFHHLRRVVKSRSLPQWLSQVLNTSSTIDAGDGAEKAYILLCPVSVISRQDLIQHLITHESGHDALYTCKVPLFPSTSAEQAANQSRELWPTTYNPNSSYGPIPAEIASATEEIAAKAGLYIALARHVAKQAQKSGRGEGVGVVVVKRKVEATAEQQEGRDIVCVAEDARYGSRRSESSAALVSHCRGDPACHAVMRAIAFVAYRRVELKEGNCSATPTPVPSATPLESAFLSSPGNLEPDGYLALNLDFYITHEPCVMCSMALVHSRVGRIIFSRRMSKTGGLAAEMGSASATGNATHDGLGYGLFWRPELNWRFLCFEWKDLEIGSKSIATGNEKNDDTEDGWVDNLIEDAHA